jgi:hypothetical protein
MVLEEGTMYHGHELVSFPPSPSCDLPPVSFHQNMANGIIGVDNVGLGQKALEPRNQPPKQPGINWNANRSFK